MRIKITVLLFLLSGCADQKKPAGPEVQKNTSIVCTHVFSKGMNPLQAALTSALMKADCGLTEEEIQLLALE